MIFAMTTIVITPDEFFLPYVRCSLAQIAKFGRLADCVLIVVPSSTPVTLLSDLSAFASRLDIDVRLVSLSPADSERIGHFKPLQWQEEQPSFATYIRLLLPSVLQEYDEVLYLDVDILIRAPLDELLSWELRSPLGAVPELVGTGEHLFGTPQTPYFNAGVIRMSLERMRALSLWQTSQDLLAKRSDIRWYDQDVLNIIFESQFDSIPLTFNVSDMLVRQNLGLPLFDNPAIVHFNGSTKPWYPSATSRFAREWQKLYARTLDFEQICDGARSAESNGNEQSGSPDLTTTSHRAHGHGKNVKARMVVPAKLKTSAKRAGRITKKFALAATVKLLRPLENLENRLNGGFASTTRRHSGAAGGLRRLNPSTAVRELTVDDQEDGLDLMISVARSGTNALGAALQSSCPHLHWMNEFYLGAGWSQLREGELMEKFPWFASRGPGSLLSVPADERPEDFRLFESKVSVNAIELTDAVLQGRRGRTLIKIFPGQLNNKALRNVLTTFRPRLLFLRREAIFTYVSRMRASELDAKEATFAKSWMNTDLTDVNFEIRERQALQYVAQCDRWFDGVESIAEELGLHSTWLTYSGLFVTGDEIPCLKAFYSNSDFTKLSGSKGLESPMLVQDRKTDPSVLALINAVCSLSAVTQRQLLRLPGRRGTSVDVCF